MKTNFDSFNRTIKSFVYSAPKISLSKRSKNYRLKFEYGTVIYSEESKFIFTSL